MRTRIPSADLVRAIVSLALLSLTAHASAFGSRTGEKNECFARHSRAWCALDAAEMSHKLADVPRPDVEAALKKAGIGAADMAMVGGLAGKLLPPPSIGTRWTDISMVLLFALLEKKPPVLGYNKAFGWMPIEMAPTADAADDLLRELIQQKTQEALKDFTLEPTTLPGSPFAARTLIFDDHFGWRVTGPDCEPGRCWLWNRRAGYSVSAPPREGKAPEWLGGYKAWVFEIKSAPSLPELWTGEAYETARYAPALSRLLPEWLFISITPQQEMRLGVSPTKPIVFNPGLRMPMVLSAGRTLLPVFPELEIPAKGAGQ